MDFSFGSAVKLYQRHTHPRVLFGPDDLPKLKRQVRTGDGRRIMQAIRRKTRPDIDRLLSAAGLAKTIEDAKRRIDGSIVWNLFDMAMVGALDDDADAIAAAKRGLASLPVAYSQPGPANSYTMMYGCHPLAYDLLFEHLSEAERAAYANWIIDGCLRPSLAASRANFIKSCGANTPICYTIPALLGLLAITGDPGVPDLAPEKAEILGMFEAALQGFLGPDGYPHEDVGYGTAVAGGLSHIVEAARRAGVYDAYADCIRYTRLGQATLQFVQPWGDYLTNNGDHTDCFLCREVPLARLAKETKAPELLWLLGTLHYPTAKAKAAPDPAAAFAEVALARKGFHVPATSMSLLVMKDFKNPRHPSDAGVPTRFHAHDRGLLSLRDSWEPDATYLNFDACHRSPHAQGHFHASAGHFSVTALGEYFAIWPSRYNMEQSCHNVVLIDGKSGRSTHGEWIYARENGVLTEYTPGDFVDFASVDSAQQHNCLWARRAMGFVRRGKSDGDAPSYLWTVEDLNKADDWADFWWQLHTSPENTIKIAGQSATITGWRKGNHMDVHFALPAPTDYPRAHVVKLEQDIATPSSHNYLRDLMASDPVSKLARPSEMVHGPVFERPRLLGKVSGYNGRFMSIMLPRLRGGAPAKVERLASVQNSLAVRITFEKVEDTLIWAYEHGMLEAGDVRARGQWCIVRRSRKSGRVISHAIGAGESLRVEGKELVAGRAIRSPRK
ncbi:MAG: hypothetical protein NTW19_06635 [Planctomycetota bacterium]|nr:hypothetical protein [Planctomycetota bacterium]